MQPKYWLNPDLCRKLYKAGRFSLEFDEKIPPFETRFEGKLEGILGAVKQSYKGIYANPTVEDAAAAYLIHLIKGHPFKNGNKRMAILFTYAFLELNDKQLVAFWEDLYQLAIELATLNYKSSNQEVKKAVREFIKVNIRESGAG